jgi:hypothetical protein
MDICFPSLIEFPGVTHFFRFFITGAQDMRDFNWSLEILRVSAVILFQLLRYVGSTLGIRYPRKRQYDSRERWQFVGFDTLIV